MHGMSRWRIDELDDRVCESQSQRFQDRTDSPWRSRRAPEADRVFDYGHGILRMDEKRLDRVKRIVRIEEAPLQDMNSIVDYRNIATDSRIVTLQERIEAESRVVSFVNRFKAASALDSSRARFDVESRVVQMQTRQDESCDVYFEEKDPARAIADERVGSRFETQRSVEVGSKKKNLGFRNAAGLKNDRRDRPSQFVADRCRFDSESRPESFGTKLNDLDDRLESFRKSQLFRDFVSSEDSSGETVRVVPPLQSLDALTSPAVKGLPPSTTPPRTLQIISEMMLSIKISNNDFNRPRDVFAKAASQLGVNWDGFFKVGKYHLTIEDVSVAVSKGATVAEAEKEAFASFVDAAIRSDFASIVDAGDERRLLLFADFEFASIGAFRYDLLCVERRLAPDQLPVCEYCRERGHVVQFCETRKAIKRLVEEQQNCSKIQGEKSQVVGYDKKNGCSPNKELNDSSFSGEYSKEFSDKVRSTADSGQNNSRDFLTSKTPDLGSPTHDPLLFGKEIFSTLPSPFPVNSFSPLHKMADNYRQLSNEIILGYGGDAGGNKSVVLSYGTKSKDAQSSATHISQVYDAKFSSVIGGSFEYGTQVNALGNYPQFGEGIKGVNAVVSFNGVPAPEDLNHGRQLAPRQKVNELERKDQKRRQKIAPYTSRIRKNLISLV